MHEEKNIDTVIQSIFMFRGTGKVELFREVLQFIAHLSVVFRMHEFRVDKDKVPASQDRDDCSEEFTVEKLDDRLVNHSETINRRYVHVMSQCRSVAVNRTLSFQKTELADVDDDDTVDDFDELHAGAHDCLQRDFAR